MCAGRGGKEMQWSQSTEFKITFSNQVKRAPTGILPGEACPSHLWSRDPGLDVLIFVCFCLRRNAFTLFLLKCVYKRVFVPARVSKTSHVSQKWCICFLALDCRGQCQWWLQGWGGHQIRRIRSRQWLHCSRFLPLDLVTCAVTRHSDLTQCVSSVIQRWQHPKFRSFLCTLQNNRVKRFYLSASPNLCLHRLSHPRRQHFKHNFNSFPCCFFPFSSISQLFTPVFFCPCPNLF